MMKRYYLELYYYLSGSSRTRTYTLRKDLIYSQASQPIAQYFLILETRMRLLRFLIKSQNGFPQYSNKLDPVSIIETRMRFELINNGFAIRCLNHSATLSFAILIGLEPIL